MTEVRELLEAAADVTVPAEPPVAAVLAAGRRRVRRRRVTVAGAGLAAAAVALAVPPLVPELHQRAGVQALLPDRWDGDTECGDVRFDRSQLPGRPVDADMELPTEEAADLLQLHGWPRAVPYVAARWTVVYRGDTGLLVATAAGEKTRYLPIHRDAGRNWVAGPPCTPA